MRAPPYTSSYQLMMDEQKKVTPRKSATFNIFTDSQAAMLRLQDDRPGPGQQAASRGIRVAGEACRRGASIIVNWVPGHAGVPGNEVADQWAVDAAAREFRASRGSEADRILMTADKTVSRAFLKSVLRGRTGYLGGRISLFSSVPLFFDVVCSSCQLVERVCKGGAVMSLTRVWHRK